MEATVYVMDAYTEKWAEHGKKLNWLSLALLASESEPPARKDWWDETRRRRLLSLDSEEMMAWEYLGDILMELADDNPLFAPPPPPLAGRSSTSYNSDSKYMNANIRRTRAGFLGKVNIANLAQELADLPLQERLELFKGFCSVCGEPAEPDGETNLCSVHSREEQEKIEP